MKKIILFLLPSKAIKSKILIQDLLINPFYSDKTLLLGFDNENGSNYHLAKKLKCTIFFIKKDYSNLDEYKYDFLISCGWGYKIPNTVIKKSSVVSFNCHSSYLPDYKGRSAYKHYWANCEIKAGVTLHLLSNKFDEGNIIIQKTCNLTLKDSPKSILIKQSNLTKNLIPKAINLMQKKSISTIPQKGGRYFYPISKYKLFFHRTINVLLFLLKVNYRFYTPFKSC